HAFASSTPPFRTAIVNMSASPAFAATDAKWLEFERKLKLMIGGVDADFRADPNGKRFLFVAAAGNRDPQQQASQCTPAGSPLYYPAAAGGAIDGLIAAGGVDRQSLQWTGSCRGPEADIVAPARKLLSTSLGGPTR